MAISILQADAYHTERNNQDWLTLDQNQKQAAILNADDYILATYAPFLDGLDSADDRLVRAYAMLALEFHSNPLSTKIEQTLKSKSIGSGSNSITTTYQDSDIEPVSDPFPVITALLAPLRKKVASSRISVVRLVR